MAEMTLEEAFEAATVDVPAGMVDDIFVIDAPNRKIIVPDSESVFGVETDMDVERKYFRCPRIVGDNIDLYAHKIYVVYVTAKDVKGTFLPEIVNEKYWCDDVAVDGDCITFSWKLSDNVMSRAGIIAFKILAVTTENGKEKTRWNTAPAYGTILMTVPDGDDIAERYPDIVTQLLERMDAVEKIATEEAMQGYVNEYLGKNPLQLDQTLTNSTKAAPANLVGGLKGDITELKGNLADKVPKKDYAPETKTESMTQPVGKDENGKLWTDPGSAYTLTETDQEAIVQQVVIAMGMPVVGTVDVNNNIILTGQLREGTYSIMYEYADGTLINVGTIRIANDDSGEQIEGYRRVEYIESSGIQYILTGITGHTGLTIEADAQLAVSPTESGDACLFGSHDGTNRCLVNYNTAGKRWELGAGDYKFGAEGSVIDVDRHKFTAIIQTGTSTFSIDDSTEITIDNTPSFDNGVEMAIFARYRGSTAERIGAYRIYSFKIIDNGVTVRNFVPVVRDLDSVVGMYDTVNGVFYTNSGTGTLTAGPNV